MARTVSLFGLLSSHNTPRFCHYTGKMYCGACQTDTQRHAIPARVVQYADVAPYPVCNMARQFLEAVFQAPSVRLSLPASALDADANSAAAAAASTSQCGVAVRDDANVRLLPVLRAQLHMFHPFVQTCPHRDKLMAFIGTRAYLMDFDDDVYSLRDLCETLNAGELCVRLRSTIGALVQHCVHSCDSCRARACVCELCRASEPIFPFQVRTVSMCDQCRQSYHRDCLRAAAACPKCARIAKRAAQ